MTLQELKAELKKEFNLEEKFVERVMLDKGKTITEKTKELTPKNAMPNIDHYLKVAELVTRFETSNKK
jgi:hypothetical protein